MPFDERTFRDALGHFPTGVAIITAMRENDEAIGMTANSFTSVSLSPPLILWCLGEDSENYDFFRKSPIFGVNILTRAQQALSERCAVPGQHALTEKEVFAFAFPHHKKTHRVPFLSHSAASFACSREEAWEAGDHVVMMGRVHAFELRGGQPLLFHRGAYHEL